MKAKHELLKHHLIDAEENILQARKKMEVRDWDGCHAHLYTANQATEVAKYYAYKLYKGEDAI